MSSRLYRNNIHQYNIPIYIIIITKNISFKFLILLRPKVICNSNWWIIYSNYSNCNDCLITHCRYTFVTNLVGYRCNQTIEVGYRYECYITCDYIYSKGSLSSNSKSCLLSGC